MKESKVINLVRQEVEAATQSGVTVRTSGGSDDLSDDLPAVIMKWDTDSISTGHIPFDRYKTDSSGDQIGTIYVKTFEVKFKLIAKSESESTKDDLCDSIQRNFLIYEDKAGLFHNHTTAWDVGGIKPRSLQAVEPNWYEGYVPVSFQFVKEVEKSGDTLTDTSNTINVS